MASTKALVVSAALFGAVLATQREPQSVDVTSVTEPSNHKPGVNKKVRNKGSKPCRPMAWERTR